MTSPRAPLPDAPRVLIVRTGAIGDVVNALVFAAALRDGRPAAHIGWVCHPLVAPLLVGNPAVDAVHLWRRGWRLCELARLLREVRGARYDVAVDLQRLQKSALLARLSGAPRVLGFDRARSKERSHLWTRERIPAGARRAHMVAQYLEFAAHLGLPAARPRWPLPPLDEARAWAAQRLAPLAHARVVVLNLGASKPAKRWPAAAFAALAERHAGDDVAFVLTGGPDDRATADAVRAAAPEVTLDLAGQTSLLQLAALLERAVVVVTGDTGAMHLAAALGRPVVALFGPSDATRTGPYGAGHVVLREPPWDGEILPDATLAGLTPARVDGELRRLLGPRG